jgi:hypothetical protein
MEPNFSLPPQAKAHYDREAESFVSELQPLPPSGPPLPPQGSLGHVPRMAHITESDIVGRIDVDDLDYLGRLHGFAVYGAGFHEFLPQDAAERLQYTAEQVAQKRELRNYCGGAYVLRHMIDWVRRRRLREAADNSWTEDLLKSLARDVRDQVILIPLEGIQIDFPFEFGQVAFNYFTESAITEMVQRMPQDTPDLTETHDYLRTSYQGRVYTRYRCTAEPMHAEALAIQHTDRALELLRMFDSAARDVRARSPIGRMGQVSPAQQHAFLMDPDGTPQSLSTEIERAAAVDFIVHEPLLAQVRQSGIGLADQLLWKSPLTTLEQHGLDAISHFAHGVALPAPQDRLIHAMVAVESLLVKDLNEPIQGPVGRRIALLTASTLDARKQVIADFQEGYGLRSGFLHHGHRFKNEAVANRVLQLCWVAIDAVMRRTQRFKTKKDLLRDLEDELLSPPALPT